MLTLTYLNLSTSHLSRATMEILESQFAPTRDGWPAMTVAPYDHGVFVTVPEVIGVRWSAMPSDLIFVLNLARMQGATVVRFDSDGDVVDGMPVFDW